jgi:uncharacterized protein YxjI
MPASGLLSHDQFFVKEHVAFAKLTDTFDILDPASKMQIGLAKDTPPGWAKWLRLLINKKLLPTDVIVTDAALGNALVFRMHRGPSFFRSKVTVHDANGMALGHFLSKVFSIGGGFWVHDAQGAQVAEIKGDWKGWDFKLLDRSGRELGVVTKKWAGIGKELFTSADNYLVAIHPGDADATATKVLLLAAALAIDIVFKEKQ